MGVKEKGQKFQKKGRAYAKIRQFERNCYVPERRGKCLWLNHGVCRRELQEMKMSFPHSTVGKEYACNAGDPGLIPGSERSFGKGNGNPLQYKIIQSSLVL